MVKINKINPGCLLYNKHGYFIFVVSFCPQSNWVDGTRCSTMWMMNRNRIYRIWLEESMVTAILEDYDVID